VIANPVASRRNIRMVARILIGALQPFEIDGSFCCVQGTASVLELAPAE
jgi:hypothetical protein